MCIVRDTVNPEEGRKEVDRCFEIAYARLYLYDGRGNGGKRTRPRREKLCVRMWMGV
jgi:hypothetical protein